MVLRNFKLFEEVDIELGSPVVFVGPNNSGKTTVLQALALWDVGVKRWSEKRGASKAVMRPGVTINGILGMYVLSNSMSTFGIAAG